MVNESPAVILYDNQGNPIGTVIDGAFYRLQVEAKLASGNNIIGTVNQGAAGAEPWAVDIQGATVSVSNMQQLAVETKLDVSAFNLENNQYYVNVPFSTDSLLSALELRFTTTSSRNINISLDDGTVLFSEAANTSLLLEIDFEDYAIDSGTILTLVISQTGAACLVDITLTAKIGTAALGGNPVLGEGGSHIGSVSIDNIGLTGAGDAFGRLRTSEPLSLFEVTHQYDLAPNIMGLAQQDAGTSIVHNSPVATLSVPAINGRKIIHQSHQYLSYLPGKGQLIRMTGNLSNDYNVVSGMGYGDGYDGIFVEIYSGTTQIKLSSSTIGETIVTQENWNIDALDGYGKSGIVLNATAAWQIIIDFSWLGVGRVRVGFDIGGIIVYVHQFLNSNFINTAYMRTGSLPVRWYLESLGGSGSMQAICASVSSEGGHNPFSHSFGYGRTTSKSTLGLGIRTPLISIRPKSTFNGLPNNCSLILSDATALTAQADNLLFEIVRNGSLTDPSWAPVNVNSHAEIDESATAITGGSVIYHDYVTSQTRITNNQFQNLKSLPLCILADGSPEILTICVTRISAAANCFAGINWSEVR